MLKQNTLKKLGWTAVIVIIIVNLFLLLKIKENLLTQRPLKFLKIEKPTLVVIFNEFECVSCVKGLTFLNEMYASLKEEGNIDFQGIILSENKTDKKNIARAFIFKFVVTDNFNIMKRLNLNQTPVIIGLSKGGRIVYSELVPMETTLTENHLRKGLIDRLYYSIDF